MTSQESLLSPYKSIGLFLDDSPPFLFSAGAKSFLAAATGHSFKLYKLPDLKIRLLGPHFPHKIHCVTAKNESLFLASKFSIYRLKYYHIEKIYTIDENNEPLRIASMFLMGDYLLAAELNSNSVFMWETEESKPIKKWPMEFPILSILHPLTYLNKILIVGKQSMRLFNIQASEIIYDFAVGLEKALELSKSNLEITVAVNSPNLHIIAIGLSSGLIGLYNIQTDTLLFKFQQTNSVRHLAFSHQEIPLLASSDPLGQINIWELNERKLFSTLKLEKGAVFLEFLESELMLISGCNNAIFQWKYDEMEANKFRIVRERVGMKETLQKIKFFGEDGLHIIASSNSENAEIRDFSLLNECMSRSFSHKIKNTVSKLELSTENDAIINEILDFDFSQNRSKDWGTLLTCHKFSTKPCLWSLEDYTLIKKRLEFLEDFSKSEEKADFITSVAVTKCGNFGLLGFKSGQVSKINLQSGAFKNWFKGGHNTPVIEMKVDNYNKCMLSLDESGNLVFWDFYSGSLDHKISSSDSRIFKIELSNYSSLFLLALENNTIEIWDLFKRLRSRRFIGHEKTITEARFTPNNRFVISTAMDRSIKIWDVISGQLINDIRVKKPIVSFDISENGEMLASVFINKREINLWHVLVRTQPWGNRQVVDVTFQTKIKDFSQGNLNERARFYLKPDDSKDEPLSEHENSKFLENFHSSDQSLGFSFTPVPEGKWLPLVYLDLIKEKNKPKITEKIEVKIPFFLDVENKDQVSQEIRQKAKEDVESKTRILESKRMMNLEEEKGTVLDRFVFQKNGNFSVVFDFLKSLNASQFDYELRSKLGMGNKTNLMRLLEFFAEIMEKPEEFDIKQVFFKTFINIAAEELMIDREFEEKLVEMKANLKTKWRGLEYKVAEVLNLIEIFGKILN